MEFQRRHGRLPGAPSGGRFTPVEAGARRRPASAGATAQVVDPWPAQPAMPGRTRSKWLVMLATVAVGVLLWSVAPLSSSPENTPAHADDDASASESTATPMLALGMSSQNVRAIEGDPVSIHDDRWDYGPSWIRFDQGEVVDWYSSPMHALKTTDSRPDTRR
jgi:hypothetical protein